MPTINDLAPATSASDTDEFLVIQAGITRKITRTQVLNGVQAALAIPSSSLLGRISTGVGAPEAIYVGQNLNFNGTTLSATATPFVISALPPGTVPATSDLVSISQAGTNAAVTYGQLLSGLASVPNVNVSQAVVKPTGSAASQTLANLIGQMLPVAGGTLTGTLVLSGAPDLPTQAANKAYVDVQISTALPLTGGSLSGALTLSAPPEQPLHSVTKSYVDAAFASALPIKGGSMSGMLLLGGDPVGMLQASTKQYSDLKLSRSGDTLTGTLILAADPVSSLQASTKHYVDAQVATALPMTGGTLLGSLTLASDPIANAQAATKQYADKKVLRSGDTLTGALMLSADPVAANQAATKNYVDLQAAGSLSRAGASMTGSLVLASDPALPLQAATRQYVDLRVTRTGDTFTGPVFLAANPTTPLQAATKGYVDGQTAASLTTAGGTFAGPVILSADPVTALQATTKQYADTRLLRTGDTLSGALGLASDPVLPTQAATKNYVDGRVLTSLPKAGGTLTGVLALYADPVNASEAATKHYVDQRLQTALPTSGGTLSGMLSLATVPTLPSQAATKQYVDTQVGTSLPTSGGSLTGTLSLASLPSSPFHAANKQYVDANPGATRVINITLPPYSAKLDGVTDDTAAFRGAYQAASTGSAIYVPFGTTVLQQPGTWGIALTKRVKWLIDGTTLSDGTPLASSIPNGGGPADFVLPGFVEGNTATGLVTSQGNSQPNDVAVQQSAYIVTHNGGGGVLANARLDTIIYNSPGSFIWGGVDRLIWAGIQTPAGAAPAQHVGRYIQTVRSNITNGTNGVPLPQPQLWAACIEYRDESGAPSSATNSSLTVEMDWFGNGPDDANGRTIQSLVIGQNDTSGAAVEVGSIIGVYLSGGSSGSTKTVFSVNLPFSNAVIDTTNARAINNAPVIKMAAGQAIAFEGTNSNRLVYDSPTATLRWYEGSVSFPVGKGICVGWVSVYSTSATLPSYTTGNIVFLIGAAPYTISLPPASTIGAGIGYTFTVSGTGAVSILPAGTDGIDLGPTTLQTNDRYHIVSNGYNHWHEVFRTNSVSPRFLGPPILPSYTVATLPGGAPGGSQAFALNGRKPTDAAGAGSGVQVFYDGQHWISNCSGGIVAA